MTRNHHRTNYDLEYKKSRLATQHLRAEKLEQGLGKLRPAFVGSAPGGLCASPQEMLDARERLFAKMLDAVGEIDEDDYKAFEESGEYETYQDFRDAKYTRKPGPQSETRQVW